MDWWLITFLNSFVVAGYMMMNGHFKVAGNTLVFGRSGLTVVAMLPFMFMLEWPTHPLFYILAVAVGFSSGFADMIMLNRIAQYGGAVVSRLVPLKIWIVFIFWMAVSPSTFMGLLTDPWRFVAVLSMLILGGVSLMFLNRCPISSKVLLAVLLPVFLWSCSDVMFKGAMMHNSVGGLTAAFQFVFIIAIIMTAVAASHLKWKGQPLKQDWKTLQVSALGALFFFMLVSLMALAMKAAPNPSYVVAVMSLNVVWIYLYHRLRNIPDKSNIFAGMLFVVSTVGLVLLTK